MTDTRKRTLFYRRVVWRNGQKRSLELLMTQAHAKLNATVDRVFDYGEDQIQGVFGESMRAGFCCHVAACVPKQATSLVPHPSKEGSLDIGVQKPPSGADFMVGDIFFIIKDNHVIICPSGLREAVVSEYLKEMMRKTGVEDLSYLFSLEPVANVNKVNLLKKEGVRKIYLNSSLYEASLDYSERQTFEKKLFYDVAQDFKALFEKDPDSSLHEIKDTENISVKLEISFNSKKKGGEVGKKRIDRIGRKIMEDDGTKGFVIETMGGKKLTADEVRISKEAELPKLASSVSRDAVFNSLRGYLDQLMNSGMLEQ